MLIKLSRALGMLALLALALRAQALPPLHETVITLDGRYNSIRTWQADFTQIFTAGLTTRTESGVLYLQKPGRMRWDYTDPVKKTFLVADDRVWQYSAGDNEATVAKVDKLSDLRTPLRFLLGHTQLEKELDHLSYSGLIPLHPDDMVIHGLPKGAVDQAGWRELWIEFTPTYRIDRLLIAGLDGSQNDIRFSKIRVNTPLPKGIFRFTPPPGVKLVSGGN